MPQDVLAARPQAREDYLKAGRTGTRRRRLPQTIKGILVDPELLQDSIEQGRPDLAPTVDGDRGSSTVFVFPPFMTSCLAGPPETEFGRRATELVGAGARHGRFRSYRVALVFRSRGAPLRSSGRLPPVLPKPPLLLASRRGTRQWKESQPPIHRAGFDRARPCNHRSSCAFILPWASDSVGYRKINCAPLRRVLATVCPATRRGK